MNLCRSLLAELEPHGRALSDMFDGCEGPRMRRLMRFARLGLVEVEGKDHVLLTENGRRVFAALARSGEEDVAATDEAAALVAFERQVHRLIGPPPGTARSAA